jgi:serine/threonine-protein kinase
MGEADPQRPENPRAVQDLTGTTVGRFAIRARLGAGGMGEVYRAEDTKLKRPVAVKRIAPHLQNDEQYRRRFLKEAERASSLSDPHIAAIHDIVEDKNEIFLVMEYVEGKTLRQRLREHVSIEEVREMAIQCAEALVAAHEKGICHRDIKPENIMLTPAGQVKMLDFGIAKRLRIPEESSVTESLPTPSGALSGTPAYMPPEVLLEKEPDARADIFSLGVVFYESLAGRHPFLAPTFVDTKHRTLHEVPAPLTRFKPEVPAELERIVAKMLAKDPAERYATVRDLLADLRALPYPALPSLPTPYRAKWRKVAVAVLAVVAFLLLVVLTPVRRQLNNWLSGVAVPREKNLAVLRFTPVGEDARAAAFGDGLTETLTTKLTQLTDRYPLQVVPASEVRAQGVTSIEQARRGLGVNLVLEGSLHRAGEWVRVNFTLVDAQTRRPIRADTITAAASDPFAVEDQVVEGVVRMLDLEVKPQERQALATHGTQVAGAFDLYTQGRGFLLNYDKPESIESAISDFQQALSLDPHFALASAGLGEAYFKKYEIRKELPLVEAARQACDRAASLDAKLVDAHVCLGTLYNGTGQYEKAVSEFQRSLEGEPTRDDAYRGLASAYEQLGRLEEAEKTYRRAISLRPQYWAGYSWLGVFCYRQARYREASEMFQRVVRLAPDSFRAYSNLGGTYIYQGRYAEAIPVFERSIAIRPTAYAFSNLGTCHYYLRRFDEAAHTYEEALKIDGNNYAVWVNVAEADYWVPARHPQVAAACQKAILLAKERLKVNPRDATTLGHLAWAHALAGEKESALTTIQQALTLAPGDPDLRFRATLVYNQLGQADRALSWLEKALAAGFSPTMVRDTPFLDNLHSSKRFQELLPKQ